MILSAVGPFDVLELAPSATKCFTQTGDVAHSTESFRLLPDELDRDAIVARYRSAGLRCVQHMAVAALR